MAYCNDKARVKRVANLAAELASRFGAHLIGLSVSPPPTSYSSGHAWGTGPHRRRCAKVGTKKTVRT
jgi:hypothetical protein